MNDIIYAGKHSLTRNVSRHAHTSWELIYCTGGCGELLFDDGTELSYGAGTVAAIPPYLPHENRSRPGFTNIHLNVQDCTLTGKTPFLVTDDSNSFILNAFLAAFHHFYGSAGQRAMLLDIYGDLIVCYLTSYQSLPTHSRVVEEIESNIIQNYPDCNYELDSYLRSFPFSYDYLRKLFKKELGVTPHKYLIDKRLQTAAEQLRAGSFNSNITEISRLCGFREPLYFSRMFKKKYGVAPSYYGEHAGSGAAPEEDADSIKIQLPKEEE